MLLFPTIYTSAYVTCSLNTIPLLLSIIINLNSLFPSTAKNSTLGLSNGGIAGIVIACVLILLIAAFMLVYLKRMGKIKPPVLGPDTSLGFENATYSRSSDKIQLDSDA
jgi:hypothetical protein